MANLQMLRERQEELGEDASLPWAAADLLDDRPEADAVRAPLQGLVDEVADQLEALQKSDGHWVFELEADVTIPAEYVLLEHHLGEIDQALGERIGVYIRARQSDHGGWSLYPGGRFDVSASVKAYYALKLIGDDPGAAHMARARRAILDHGGAARSNVFTRTTLALFGQLPWRAVPLMPVELVLLPRWCPFHLDKVAYWSRVVIVPLTILGSLKPRARNPAASASGSCS